MQSYFINNPDRFNLSSSLSAARFNDTSLPIPPPLGQIFQDLETRKLFYYRYVGFIGFDVIKSSFVKVNGDL